MSPPDHRALVPCRSADEQELISAIRQATRLALHDLFADRPGSFYYIALITTGEALPPLLSAWSREALAAAVAKTGAADETLLKWSYADSPYLCFGERHFAEVNRLFALRPGIDTLDEDGWQKEYTLRLDAMEQAIRLLDDEGAFGTGDERSNLVVNVEVMPPDHTNTERAYRLNPEGSPALIEWLEEAGEE